MALIPDFEERYELVRENSFRILRMWGADARNPKEDFVITRDNVADVMSEWSSESYTLKKRINGKSRIRLIYAILDSGVLDPNYKGDETADETVSKSKKPRKKTVKKKAVKKKDSKQIGINSVRLTMEDDTLYVLVHEGALSSVSKDYVQDRYHSSYKMDRFYLLAGDHILSPEYSLLENRKILSEMSLSTGDVKIIPLRAMDLHLIPYRDRIPSVEFLGSSDELLEVERPETIMGTYPSLAYRYILPIPREQRKAIAFEDFEEELKTE